MAKKDIKEVTSYELEQNLAKLYLYIELSLKTKEYKSLYSDLEKIKLIVSNWIGYYAQDKDLHRVSEEEAYAILTLRDNMDPLIGYEKPYYDEIVVFIDVVLYCASVPLNKEFDEREIITKGVSYYGRQR